MILIVASCAPKQTPTALRDPLAEADPLHDCFDKYGAVQKGAELWLDITGTRVYRSGGHYTVRIELGGPVPEQFPASTFVEWDILIDADRDTRTGQKWPLIANDIGYDYLARVARQGTNYSQMVYRVADGSIKNINYRVENSAIELYVAPELIGGSQSFDWVVAIRKYQGDAPPDFPTFSDKAPNAGHGLAGP